MPLGRSLSYRLTRHFRIQTLKASLGNIFSNGVDDLGNLDMFLGFGEGGEDPLEWDENEQDANEVDSVESLLAFSAGAWCAFFGRNLHSRMPLDRLKRTRV
jgi:hypothetical protein